MNVKPENDPTLVHWVIRADWAHPFWHSYSLVLVHLRPLPSVREPDIYLPGATHEMWLHALNPDYSDEALIKMGIVAPLQWLTPTNFAAQLIETDENALARIEEAVKEICSGTLSPDTDFVQMWILKFGDSMMIREKVQ